MGWRERVWEEMVGIDEDGALPGGMDPSVGEPSQNL